MSDISNIFYCENYVWGNEWSRTVTFLLSSLYKGTVRESTVVDVLTIHRPKFWSCLVDWLFVCMWGGGFCLLTQKYMYGGVSDNSNSKQPYRLLLWVNMHRYSCALRIRPTVSFRLQDECAPCMTAWWRFAGPVRTTTFVYFTISDLSRTPDYAHLLYRYIIPTGINYGVRGFMLKRVQVAHGDLNYCSEAAGSWVI